MSNSVLMGVGAGAEIRKKLPSAESFTQSAKRFVNLYLYTAINT